MHWYKVVNNFVVEKPGKPDAPVLDKVDKTWVSLSWKPPASDGGAEITNYMVEYRTEDAFKWTHANIDTVKETRYKVTGLREGMVYEFRIAAENRAGVGPASEPTKPVKAKEPQCMFIRKSSTCCA